MLDPTTDLPRQEQFVTEMAQQMTILTRHLSDWVAHEAPTLETIEHHLLRTLKDLAATLLTGLCHLAVPAAPPATVPCPCGATARYQRQRPATSKTVVGPITLTRPYYLCSACHQGLAPLDQQLELCAGGLSAGLAALSALLGATQSSFAAAAEVLETLTLVSLSPTTIRQVTEGLGEVLLVHEAQTLTTLETTTTPPPVRHPPARRMYVSLDGLRVHLHGTGWTECKLGTVYTTTTRRSRTQPEQVDIRGVDHSFVADLTGVTTFGRRLWAEAAQRGVLAADEVVVLGDGAHWIWNLASDYFPGAVQIVDWYHASSYVWGAAHALYGDGSAAAQAWAAQQLELLWAGQVRAVVANLQAQRAVGGAVDEAITYYTNHQTRMDYPSYRARGLQIGSGSIESGCKQVLAARLKHAGMIWSHDGALAVATVRTWRKSGRWAAALQLRPPQRRRYVRQGRAPTPGAVERGLCAVPSRGAARTGTAALTRQEARKQGAPAGAALPNCSTGGHPTAEHPWRRAWSIRRQRQLAAAHDPPAPTEPSP